MDGHTEALDPKEIILPKDYNPDMEKIESIRESLREHKRMFHAPIVKDNKEVVAGRARIFAARGVLESVDCTVVPSNLEAADYKLMSLHENLKRDNLPWDEQVVKEKELHELRQLQHGVGKQGKKSGWSLRDTAAELNVALGTLSEDLRMADAILADPTLARIKDKTTARKVIFESSKRLNQEMGASVPVNFDFNVCLHGGSEVVLRIYPSNSFDACITDPPWLEFKDESLTRDEFTLPVFKEVYRVLKENAFLYAFVSTQDWIYYYEELRTIGFNVQKFPLIWVKEGVLTHGRKSWEYQRDYEPILLAVKGSPATTSSMLSSIMSCKVVPSTKLIHPNEKPTEVIKRILNDCTFEGSLVLDPFAGSFVVPDTCKKMRRRYVAIEKDNKFYQQGVERLKDK